MQPAAYHSSACSKGKRCRRGLRNRWTGALSGSGQESKARGDTRGALRGRSRADETGAVSGRALVLCLLTCAACARYQGPLRPVCSAVIDRAPHYIYSAYDPGLGSQLTRANQALGGEKFFALMGSKAEDARMRGPMFGLCALEEAAAGFWPRRDPVPLGVPAACCLRCSFEGHVLMRPARSWLTIAHCACSISCAAQQTPS